MLHPSDAHAPGGIVDGIDHAPMVFVALQLFGSRRSGIVGQREKLAFNAVKKRIVKSNSFCADRLISRS